MSKRVGQVKTKKGEVLVVAGRQDGYKRVIAVYLAAIFGIDVTLLDGSFLLKTQTVRTLSPEHVI